MFFGSRWRKEVLNMFNVLGDIGGGGVKKAKHSTCLTFPCFSHFARKSNTSPVVWGGDSRNRKNVKYFSKSP